MFIAPSSPLRWKWMKSPIGFGDKFSPHFYDPIALKLLVEWSYKPCEMSYIWANDDFSSSLMRMKKHRLEREKKNVIESNVKYNRFDYKFNLLIFNLCNWKPICSPFFRHTNKISLVSISPGLNERETKKKRNSKVEQDCRTIHVKANRRRIVLNGQIHSIQQQNKKKYIYKE